MEIKHTLDSVAVGAAFGGCYYCIKPNGDSGLYFFSCQDMTHAQSIWANVRNYCFDFDVQVFPLN